MEGSGQASRDARGVLGALGNRLTDQDNATRFRAMSEGLQVRAHRKASPGWLKPLIDYGPIAVFFVAYLLYDLMAATAALMAATAVALGISLTVARRVPIMPLITAAVVAVFGGLTLWLQDDTFIKMKPTIVQAIFAVVLLGGLLLDKPLLKLLLGQALDLSDAGWRQLTLRFGLFFVAMAALNEVVWRTQTTDLWVTFKVFGIMALTLAFTVAQVPFLRRHQVAEESDPKQRS
jgi:intracellular septation protein